MDGNHLCNFSRGQHEVYFCEITLNLDQWFRRRLRLKDFLSGALLGVLFGALLVAGIRWNNSVKYF